MSNETWWWCAYLQAVTKWDEHDSPESCPICNRNVDQQLSTHHDLLADIAEIPWGECPICSGGADGRTTDGPC